MATRLSTFREAQYIVKDMNAVYGGKEGEKADGATRVIWAIAGGVGAVSFFGSFAFLFMPIWGWGWPAAVASFIGAQWFSTIFIELKDNWAKACGWLWCWKQWLTRKTWDQIIEQLPPEELYGA